MKTEMRFLGFDHIDARVRSVSAVTPFYDALMPALGLSKIVVSWQTAREYYEPEQTGVARRFFGLHENPQHVHGDTRIAFTVPSREDVDRIAAIVRQAGGCAIEGPEEAYQHEPYYAIFFEDPDGWNVVPRHSPAAHRVGCRAVVADIRLNGFRLHRNDDIIDDPRAFNAQNLGLKVTITHGPKTYDGEFTIRCLTHLKAGSPNKGTL